MKKTYYSASFGGSADCRHLHRTFEAAEKCLRKIGREIGGDYLQGGTVLEFRWNEKMEMHEMIEHEV